MDLSDFAAAVADSGPVTLAGLGTRGGACLGVRSVSAPGGISELLPAEMTVRCGAGTPVDELADALRVHGQYVALPPGGTVGGALAVGRSDVYRLGHGPVRDAVLQVRYVGADGRLVKAGGATVKNVSGFDLCRLLVGSWGTLGFLGEVILRTRPLPPHRQWFVTGTTPPKVLLSTLYRPASVLWDGHRTWFCLEGHPTDVAEQVARTPDAVPVESPPPLPTGSRRSMRPAAVHSLQGVFVAEVGVGVVHHAEPANTQPAASPEVVALNQRIKKLFDPTGRLNPSRDVLATKGIVP